MNMGNRPTNISVIHLEETGKRQTCLGVCFDLLACKSFKSDNQGNKDEDDECSKQLLPEMVRDGSLEANYIKKIPYMVDDDSEEIDITTIVTNNKIALQKHL